MCRNLLRARNLATRCDFKDATDTLGGSVLVVRGVAGEKLNHNVTGLITRVLARDTPQAVGECSATV